jgi:hypothetical protein
MLELCLGVTWFSSIFSGFALLLMRVSLYSRFTSGFYFYFSLKMGGSSSAYDFLRLWMAAVDVD